MLFLYLFILFILIYLKPIQLVHKHSVDLKVTNAKNVELHQLQQLLVFEVMFHLQCLLKPMLLQIVMMDYKILKINNNVLILKNY